MTCFGKLGLLSYPFKQVFLKKLGGLHFRGSQPFLKDLTFTTRFFYGQDPVWEPESFPPGNAEFQLDAEVQPSPL